MTVPDSTLQFDFDTLTVSQALPWFRGALLILIGCSIAGLMAMFGLSMKSKRQQPGNALESVDGQSPETLILLRF